MDKLVVIHVGCIYKLKNLSSNTDLNNECRAPINTFLFLIRDLKFDSISINVKSLLLKDILHLI